MPIAGIIVALLGFAAWRDLATRTIPDMVTVAVMLAGVAVRLSEGWAALAISAGVSIMMFFLLLPFHGRGLIGGGDLKLLAAITLGLSPLSSYQMISAVILAGGVLAFAYLSLRWALRHLGPASHVSSRRRFTSRLVAIESWRIRKGAPLPYGIAIAVGASLVIGQQGV